MMEAKPVALRSGRQKMERVVALVPMRHHSERVPGKNMRPLAGRPLYEHILRALTACPLVSAIVVDTDSPEIKDGLRTSFPAVTVLDRPQALRGADVPMNAVLEHDITEVEAPFYLQTHSTNPLLRSQTIVRAIDAFFESYPQHDSLFSVTRLQTRLWDARAHPINHDPSELLRTQDLPPVYEENSCLYIFERSAFLARKNRIGERPLMFEVDADEAWDIDEELDFQIADFLMMRRMKEEGGS